MSRKDLPWLLILLVLFLFWGRIDRNVILPLFQPPDGEPPPAAPVPPPPPVPDALPPVEAPAEPPRIVEPPPDAEPPADAPERTFTLSNERVEMTFSSRGASLIQARLLEFPETPAPDSPRVLLDFREWPALSYSGFPGLGIEHDFEVRALESGLRFERVTATGIRLVRTVTLDEAYLLSVRDVFFNESGAPVAVEPHGLRIGRLAGRAEDPPSRVMEFLGLDTLSPGGRVSHWGKGFAKAFRPETRGGRMAGSVERLFPEDGRRVDWAALKEKYFVVILTPEDGADAVRAVLERRVEPREIDDPGYRPRNAVIGSAAAELVFSGRILPAAEAPPAELSFTLYAGPKQFDELRRLAAHQVRVMEFGMWRPIGTVLLQTMNAFYRLIPNYGLAIILLTCLIRAVFWPLTHKSGKSMRKMQELQPEVARIKAAVKEPQKQQREIMELYKRNKVNPVSGCLPMIIQIPVFIALFVVLRSAIELRFAPFLWIRDLSEPENLLPGVLPFVSGLNLLPLIMTGVQIWQQKLTPTTGDPTQQRMMTFMPVLFLVLFYNFASGLVLYWTVSQLLAVLQMALQRRHAQHQKPAP